MALISLKEYSERKGSNDYSYLRRLARNEKIPVEKHGNTWMIDENYTISDHRTKEFYTDNNNLLLAAIDNLQIYIKKIDSAIVIIATAEKNPDVKSTVLSSLTEYSEARKNELILLQKFRRKETEEEEKQNIQKLIDYYSAVKD